MSQPRPPVPGACAAFDEDLSALLDHELSPEREAEVRAHVATCPECRGRLAAVARADSALRSAASARTRDALPAGVADRFRARLEAERTSGRDALRPATGNTDERRQRAAPAPRTAAARRARWIGAALAVAAAVTLVLLVSPRPGPLAPPITPGSLGSLDDATDEEIALALDLETVEDLEVIEMLDVLEGSG